MLVNVIEVQSRARVQTAEGSPWEELKRTRASFFIFIPAG